MEKKESMPKLHMNAGVAAMGLGLFSTLQNEASATGGRATIECSDTERVGEGILRGIICKKYDEPFCGFEFYKLPFTHSTCD